MKATLAEHLQSLLDEKAGWLRQPPEDIGEWRLRMIEKQMPGRLQAAAMVDKEINEAVVLLHAYGYCDKPSERGDGEGRQVEDDRANGAIGWSLQPVDAEPVAQTAP